MLKMTGVELELISETEMCLFVEKGMGGGISYIPKDITKPNDKYMSLYDDSKRNRYITYFDANHFCGWAKSQYLAYSWFEWLNQKVSDRFDINLISKNNFHGYILEIDPEYYDKLHEFHNDYPLAPGNLEISRDMLSKYGMA